MYTTTRRSMFLSVAASVFLLCLVEGVNAQSPGVQGSTTPVAQQRETRRTSQQTAVASVNPCLRTDSLEAACLKQRLDESASRLDELEKSLESLRSRLEALERRANGIDSIGDPQQGKDDGYDDLWSAIRNLGNRLKKLER